MRLIRLLAALAFIALGVVVGALNAQPVTLDLAFASLHSTLGICILAALLLGVVLGGLVLTASVVLPLRQRLRTATARRPSPASNGEIG
ncbi:MAG: lipopolysaccharide assembly protein LapA domain-containing protein [Luteimonas sp.]